MGLTQQNSKTLGPKHTLFFYLIVFEFQLKRCLFKTFHLVTLYDQPRSTFISNKEVWYRSGYYVAGNWGQEIQGDSHEDE